MTQFHHFTLMAALLLLLSLAADASIYRTIITTEVSQGDGGQMPQQCGQEMMQVDMTQCKRYIREQASSSSVLEMTKGEGREEVPQHCCQQIGQLSEQCRCPAVAWATWDATGSYQGRKAQQAVQAAEKLTGQCDLKPERCEFRQQS